MFPTTAQLLLHSTIASNPSVIPPSVELLRDTIRIRNKKARFCSSCNLLHHSEQPFTKSEVTKLLSLENHLYQNLTCCYLEKEQIRYSIVGTASLLSKPYPETEWPALTTAYMIRWGWWLEEKVGSHLHIIGPDDEAITNSDSCDCLEYISNHYHYCKHTHFAKYYLRHRAELHYLATEV